MTDWIPVPYTIYGVEMWAAQSEGGFIDWYYVTKEQAQARCDELNDIWSK